MDTIKNLLKIDNPIRMQGQYEDEETGLYYNRYRYYDPVISAYVSQDPLGLGAGENIYSYVKNSFGWIDPLGLCSKKSGSRDNPKVKTNPNSAYFWSGRTDGVGGAERALEIAKSRNGTTLEGLIESKGIKMPEWDINNPNSIKAWEDISASYANQVSGKVHAVVGNQLRPGNIWENVELPRLKGNLNVTEIITIDPKTLTESIIFRR